MPSLNSYFPSVSALVDLYVNGTPLNIQTYPFTGLEGFGAALVGHEIIIRFPEIGSAISSILAVTG